MPPKLSPFHHSTIFKSPGLARHRDNENPLSQHRHRQLLDAMSHWNSSLRCRKPWVTIAKQGHGHSVIFDGTPFPYILNWCSIWQVLGHLAFGMIGNIGTWLTIGCRSLQVIKQFTPKRLQNSPRVVVKDSFSCQYWKYIKKSEYVLNQWKYLEAWTIQKLHLWSLVVSLGCSCCFYILISSRSNS